jgi:hypothetical protein
VPPPTIWNELKGRKVEATEPTTPILTGPQWLDVVDNTEEGEEIPAPLGLLPFIRGTVTTFGAETRVGKTVFGLQAWRWVVDQGYGAAYCTLEMSPSLLFKRFVKQFESEHECRDWIRNSPADISHSYLDYKEVEQIIRSGYDFVVLDHIHELPFDGQEDLSRQVKRIASLAPETDTAILMLSQMKQSDPDFDYGPPSIYDYSWTKAIPEVSSVCYAAWRPRPEKTEIELLNLKNRFGFEQEKKVLSLDNNTVTFMECHPNGVFLPS